MIRYGSLMLCFCVLKAFCFETEIVVLRAVRGRDAQLPCGQGKVFLDGPDSYVLWLKNDKDFLYRFPNEESESRSINRDRIYGTSCDSSSCHDETSLLLKRVSDEDAGIYRCRVHYQASSSIDYVIDVRLVESPGMPRIYNEDGELINQSHVGPLSLGSDLTLVCEVDDEQPDTLVYWRRNSVVVEHAHVVRPGLLRSVVRVRSATRAELDAHYECLAQNADVTEPLSAGVVLRMYLPPISVEIRLNNNFDFEAGQPRVVDCVVVGCVPPPLVTWHLGDTLLRPTVHKELHDGNYTVSSLTLTPSLRDNKRELVCRAHNSYISNDVFEDKAKLNVGHRPLCVTNREETVGVVVREAETLTCVVEASPEPMQFSWTFADSRSLYTSVKKLPGQHHRYSSTLTWLPRDGDFGPLYCRATNSFGEQKKPCAYAVTQGGAPRSPDCGILRAYPDTLQIECQKGWDGGRPQVIHLELFSGEGSLLYNVSNEAGLFQLRDAENDGNLTVITYAASERGKSNPKTMYLQTVDSSSASATADNSSITLREQWIEASSGFMIVGIFVVAIALGLRLLKYMNDKANNSDLVPHSDGVFHREPDFEREERLLGTANVTVNQVPACQNQRITPPPVPLCRFVVECADASAPLELCPTTRQSYFV